MSGISEVVIYGKFTTGTTIDDPEKAKAECEKILFTALEAAHVFKSNDLFQFEHVKTEVTDIR